MVVVGEVKRGRWWESIAVREGDYNDTEERRENGNRWPCPVVAVRTKVRDAMMVSDGTEKHYKLQAASERNIKAA